MGVDVTSLGKGGEGSSTSVGNIGEKKDLKIESAGVDVTEGSGREVE
jgi:hypothetical protein